MLPCDSVCNKKWCRNEIYEKNQNKNIGFIQPPFIIPTTNEYGNVVVLAGSCWECQVLGYKCLVISFEIQLCFYDNP